MLLVLVAVEVEVVFGVVTVVKVCMAVVVVVHQVMVQFGQAVQVVKGLLLFNLQEVHRPQFF